MFPEEEQWLANITPATILSNAHRFYDFMHETGMSAESVVREAAFEKAANALGISYDVLYNAWMNGRPASTASTAA